MAKTAIINNTSSSRLTNEPKGKKKINKDADKTTKEIEKQTLEATKNDKTTKQLEKDAAEMAEQVQRQVFHFVEHLQQWIEKNSQPRRYNFTAKWLVRREPTRWAKRGPMARKDWMRFYNWAAKNAEPKPPYVPKVKAKESTLQIKQKQSIPLEDLMEHAALMAIPRRQRKKYEYPPTPEYTYSPQIDTKRPAKRDRGRPFRKPEVPKDFQHIDIEIDFWSQLRFPMKASTATYNPTENILKLSQPKVVPPAKQHCPIPEKPVEYIAPRQRMTKRQWREHKIRLAYLAKPIYRPVIDYYYN